MVLGEPRLPLSCGLILLTGSLESFPASRLLRRVGGLLETSLQVPRLGVVCISSAHISLGKSQTNNYKEGWKTWLNCVPRKERKRWFLFKVQLAIFITVVFKDILTLWRLQLLKTLPMLTCFSEDFGMKFHLLYSIKCPVVAEKNAVTKTSLPPAAIYLWVYHHFQKQLQRKYQKKKPLNSKIDTSLQVISKSWSHSSY